jgi:predicted N-formylglutamate amidohydrolase
MQDAKQHQRHWQAGIEQFPDFRAGQDFLRAAQVRHDDRGGAAVEQGAPARDHAGMAVGVKHTGRAAGLLHDLVDIRNARLAIAIHGASAAALLAVLLVAAVPVALFVGVIAGLSGVRHLRKLVAQHGYRVVQPIPRS